MGWLFVIRKKARRVILKVVFRNKPKVYIASKLKHKSQTGLNSQIASLCKDRFEVFSPQEEVLPNESSLSPKKILYLNLGAIDDCDVFILVFDRCDSGAAMEYMRAKMLGKTIIGYRTVKSIKKEDIGKMMEGVWETLPDNMRVSSLDELKKVINKI
jgi:nucleoside 2-deoxyribosyltransferase